MQIHIVPLAWIQKLDWTVVMRCLSVCDDVERRMPVIEPFDCERTLPEGERLKLICKASGNPRPVLYWYHKGRVLEATATDDSLHNGPSRHSR